MAASGVSRTWRKACVHSAVGALGLFAGAALGQESPVMLQWYECRWADMERRIPDFFMGGYGSVLVPPVSRAGIQPTGNGDSVGYDPWDRFDLGVPGAQTAYGTEDYFRALVGEFHRAGAQVYVDAVLNHNAPRRTEASFMIAGGYPGFWMAPPVPMRNKLPTDNWGDFHAGHSTGYYQSENPNGPFYDLFRGDLVSLIDIAQETNHQFIRQPVAPGNPQNIPGGTTYNLPNPGNARFYPDRDQTGTPVSNPGTARNPGALNFTFYPFNGMNGDAVAENGTGYLMRWTQYMLDEHRVDGFRWDAVKHVPSWFWDSFIDSVLYNRRVTPDGRRVTAFSFGESVAANDWTYQNYVRKPNNLSNQPQRAGDWFGNRDCLDLAGAGALRDLLNASGFGDWQNVLNAHLDLQDGGQDGTLGVFHVFSHDNGTVGDGSSAPPLATIRQQGLAQHAYILTRTGYPLVYHNARGITRGGGFWPRAGADLALGLDLNSNTPSTLITRLVRIHNELARGSFFELNFTDPVNPSKADVLVFDRRSGGQANLLVALNDRYDAGFDQRSVQTAFPPGTRLHEQTGNAADPIVDPGNSIPEVLVVGGDQRVLLSVPRNVSSAGTHNRGYVIYSPALPNGTLTVSPSSSALPADASNVPQFRRRMNAVPVITSPTFTIELATTPGDALDINTDSDAVYRFNAGYRDTNGNGRIDFPHTAGVRAGYEDFVTFRQPAYNGATAGPGLYRQTINAAQLGEGFHYLSVLAFRNRAGNLSPLFREFRAVVYVDLTGPAVSFPNPPVIDQSSYAFAVRASDRTANRVHLMLNVPPQIDPRSLVTVFNQATRQDRFDWFRTLTNMAHGFNEVAVVAFEESGNSSVNRYPVFVNICRADFNRDGQVDFFDYLDFAQAFSAEDPSADFNGDGQVDFFDYLDFVERYASGC